jgi:hypothetical protein
VASWGVRWALLLVSLSIACASAEAPAPAVAAPKESPEPAEPEEASPEPVAAPPTSPEPAEPTEPEVVPPTPDASTPVCGDTTVAAVRTALATAVENGVNARHLADCRPEDVACKPERAPIEATDACQLVAHPAEARWEIVIVPQPATGAPTDLEIWVDTAGKEPGNVRIDGSTWGVASGVRIQGRGVHTSHTHGGAPAHIGGASFEVTNRRDTAVELELLGTRWLTAFSCELPREVRARPKPAGIAIEPDLIDGKMAVRIPAKTTKTVELGHESQDAYMAWCDRFATAATFEIDGKRVEVIAEHRVVRREPLRRREP